MYNKSRDPFANPFANIPAESSNINPYVQKLKLLSQDTNYPFSCGEKLKTHKGHWKTYLSSFSPQQHQLRKIFVEVGCYTGSTIMQMSQLNQDVGFIGLDITFKRAFTSSNKFYDNKLTNAHCVLFDGKYLDRIFDTHELDGLFIFFPDPWEKKKHKKNRLINEDFVLSMKGLIKPNGFFWFKTDRLEYFEMVCKLLSNQDFEKVDVLEDPFFNYSYSSPFEKTFNSQSIPTFSAIWRKSC